MKELISFFFCFVKIGLVGFGGGSALIPVIEDEVVEKRQLLTCEEFSKFIVVSNITPGALPVKLSALVGYKLYGLKGSVIAALGFALPVTLVLLTILAFMSAGSESLGVLIARFSAGATIYIIYLIMKYMKKSLSISEIKNNYRKWIVFVFACLLTIESELVRFIEMLTGREIFYNSFFDIASVDVIIILFFMIFTISFNQKKWFVILCSVIAGVYALASGNINTFSGIYKFIILALMFVVVFLAFYHKHRVFIAEKIRTMRVKSNRIFIVRITLVLLLVFMLLMFSAVLPNNEPISYMSRSTLTTVTSFGGGAALIPIAEGVFVDGGTISYDLYYTQVVPLANALPGTLLVKLVSAIGLISFQDNFLLGVALALFGFVITVGISIAISVLTMLGYRVLCEYNVIKTLQSYIAPVICGILFPTILTLLHEPISLLTELGFTNMLSFLIVACIVIALVLLISIKTKVRNELVLIGLLTINVIVSLVSP